MVLFGRAINRPIIEENNQGSRLKSGLSIVFRALIMYAVMYLVVAAVLYPNKLSEYKIAFEDDARMLNRELSFNIGRREEDIANRLLREFSTRDHVHRVVFTSKPNFMPNLFFGEVHSDDWIIQRPIYDIENGVFYGELEIGYEPIYFIDQLKDFNHIFVHLFGFAGLLLFFYIRDSVRRDSFRKLLSPIANEMTIGSEVDSFKRATHLAKTYAQSHREKTDRLTKIIDEIRSLHLSSFDDVAMPIAVVDIDGRIVRTNNAFVHLFAPTGRQIEGRFFYQFLSSELRKKFVESIEMVSAEKPSARMAIKILVDGEEEQLPATLSIAYDSLSKERIIVVENKAEVFVLRNRLESALAYDLNTCLLKKNGLIENIGGLLRVLDSKRMRVGVVIFKLNSLSRIRDLYGIGTVERLMEGLADITRRRVSPDAITGLLSDNELVIAVHSTRGNIHTEVLRAITPIKQYLCEVIYIKKRPIQVSHTLGLAIWPEGGSTVEKLLQCASISSTNWDFDDPLSRIEYDDKNKYSDDYVSVKAVLTNAVAEGRIEFDLQPIYGMKTDTVSMYELLVRLVTQDGVRILPRDFLDIAEQMGLMGDIAQAEVNAACDIFARSGSTDDQYMLTINLSITQLLLPDLLDILLPLRPYRSRVILEVQTNNEIYHVKVTKVLHSLVESGFTIAADDIDATNTNAVKLTRLPIQIIKIDKVFFKLLENEEGQDIVYNYLEHVRDKNKELIIEQIETEEELQIARDLDLDYAQGHFLGRPRDPKRNTDEGEARHQRLKKQKSV